MLEMKAKVEGMEKVQNYLTQLRTKMRTRINRTAVGKGTRLMKAAVKENSNKSDRTGTMSRSIQDRIKLYDGGLRALGVVGPGKDYEETMRDQEGKAYTLKPNNYAHLLEFGHAAVSMSAKVLRLILIGGYVVYRRKTGRAIAKPFMRPAYDTHGQTCVDAIANSYKEQMGL
jgi:HK97 gp10 family phage protein